MNKIIVAIDGYSACGKSTTARAVAARLGYIYADSGAMYRAVTHYLIENNISFTDIDSIEVALNDIEIGFDWNEQGDLRTYINGELVEEQIRRMEISENVSSVAAISVVRKAMVRIQHKLGENKGIVMDGRDIGTVVFPKAELKIFMTADPEIRAQRRLKELLDKGVEASLDEVMTNLSERDQKDTTREDSPLRQAVDATIIDNSNMTFDEQVDEIVTLAKEKIGD